MKENKGGLTQLMSPTYIARVYLGILIETEDIWESVPLSKGACPNGHELTPNARFCPICGSPQVFTRKTPGPALHALGKIFQLPPEKAWDQLTRHDSDWKLVPVAALMSPGQSEKLWLFGQELSSISSYGISETPDFYTLPELENGKKIILERLQGTDLEIEQVVLFPTLAIQE